MVKEKISTGLREIVQELGVAPDVHILLEIPTDFSHGDYTTNIAFQLSKTLRKPPMQIAQEISTKLNEKLIDGLEKIEAVNPGFINFTIAKKELISFVNQVLDDKEKIYKSIKTNDPKFEIYENTGPNTNKPLHIGHIRNITLGESIVHLRKKLGHKVWSGNINNDRGIHIIKCMWAYLQFGKNKFQTIEEAKEFVLPDPFENWKETLRKWFSDNSPWHTPKELQKKQDHVLGIFYLLGDRAAKEFPDSMTQMKEMLLAWEDGETHIRLLWEMMNGWFYEGFRQTHARFLQIAPSDQQYDKEWYESELYKAGRQLILDNVDKGVFYRNEEKVTLADLSKYNLPDKVVIRSDGSSLYITFDLEEAREMAQDYHADVIAHVVSNEQDLYFKQLFSIVDALGIAPKDRFMHISYGTVYLNGGEKMSSREGTVILGDDLLDIVKTKIKASFPNITDETAEKVMISAIKYTILKYNPKADINFDIDQSVSLDGNSGPYIQYTYARTQSILRKSQNIGEVNSDALLYNKAYCEIEEYCLIRLLYQYPEMVQKAALTYSPNVVCEYLFGLAQEFNLFYQKHRILDATDTSDRVFRLKLTQAVGEVISEGLRLLGIAAPSEM